MKNIKIRRMILTGSACLFLGALYYFRISDPEFGSFFPWNHHDTAVQLVTETESIDPSLFETESGMMIIYVTGAVLHPGVYEVPEGGRVYQAVALAGGMTENADISRVNQAEFLHDADQVYIPALGDPVAENTGMKDTKININTADSSELQKLPGIGESKAQAILTYREKNGGFGNVEDIMNVTGIGENLFSDIQERIKV